MLDCNEGKPPMFRAHLIDGLLTIEEVSAHVVARIGTVGLAVTPLGACEVLKKQLLDQLAQQMKCIDWQSQQFVPRYGIEP